MIDLNINEETLNTQRKVVVEEFHEVCLNKPYGDNYHHLGSLAFQKHPYRWPPIGISPDHINEATLDEVMTFYHKYYHPSNAIISISGPLHPDESFALVEKWFGKIAQKKIHHQDIPIEPPQLSPRYKIVRAEVPKPMLIGGFHMPGRMDKEYCACDLLSDVLANGKSSRLYKRLVKSSKVMTSIDCYITGSKDPGLFIFEGLPAADVSSATAYDAIMEEVLRLQSEPPDERELQKVKNKSMASIVMSDLTILNKAASMSYYEYLGDLDMLNRQVEIYQSTTLDDILSCASKYLHPDNSSFVEYQPS